MSDSSSPQLNKAVDVTTLSLDATEGYLLSRIDGDTPADMLAELVGLSEDRVVSILHRLVELGAVSWDAPSARPKPSQEPPPEPSRARPPVRSPAPSRAAPSAASAKVSAPEPSAPKPEALQKDPALEAALAENVELSRSEKLHILVAQRDVRERTHWDVLGLRGKPSGSDIKKAYFRLSKQFHPDRFFGRDLGSFAGRLNEVFEGIKRAYDVLGKEKSRAAYREKYPPQPDERLEMPPVKSRFGANRDDGGEEKPAKKRPMSTRSIKSQRDRLEKRRQEILEGRKKKKAKPLEEQNLRATELYELGLEQLGKGDLAAAAGSLKIAAAYSPNNAEYQARYEDVQQQAVHKRSKDLVEAADVELATGQTGAAARLFGQASDMAPSNAGHAIRAAELYDHAGDAQAAFDYAQRAVKASPRRKEARVLLGKLLITRGDNAGALSHLEIAASLDKSDAHVKKMVKELSKKLKA